MAVMLFVCIYHPVFRTAPMRGLAAAGRVGISGAQTTYVHPQRLQDSSEESCTLRSHT